MPVLHRRIVVVDEDEVVVEAGRRRLHEVLVHLLNNAIRFTSEGEVCLCAEREDGARVRFSVSDTGPGIASERIPGLLRPTPAAAVA